MQLLCTLDTTDGMFLNPTLQNCGVNYYFLDSVGHIIVASFAIRQLQMNLPIHIDKHRSAERGPVRPEPSSKEYRSQSPQVQNLTNWSGLIPGVEAGQSELGRNVSFPEGRLRVGDGIK